MGFEGWGGGVQPPRQFEHWLQHQLPCMFVMSCFAVLFSDLFTALWPSTLWHRRQPTARSRYGPNCCCSINLWSKLFLFGSPRSFLWKLSVVANLFRCLQITWRLPNKENFATSYARKRSKKRWRRRSRSRTTSSASSRARRNRKIRNSRDPRRRNSTRRSLLGYVREIGFVIFKWIFSDKTD